VASKIIKLGKKKTLGSPERQDSPLQLRKERVSKLKKLFKA
jgi:hypothetical protein